MYDLTGFQRDLLHAALSLENPDGLDLKAHLEEYYPGPIHHGKLYPHLQTLVQRGLLSKTQQDRRTNFYDLTERGRRELRNRRDWENENAPEEFY